MGRETRIICVDTRGGTQPYVALGLGLKAAGHHVRIVAPSNYEAFVARHGLDFWGLEGDVEGLLTKTENLGVAEKGFWKSHLLLIRMARQTVLKWMEGSLAGCQGADLILGGFGGMLVGASVAEKLGVPFVQAHLQPLTVTSEFPGAVTPGLWRLDNRFVNALSHRYTQQLFWQPLRPAINAARRRVLGLSPLPFAGILGAPRRGQDTILYGYSSHVLPRPSDWPSSIHVTGYWFLETAKAWSPDPRLQRFLESGSKPVLVGFGSMGSSDAARTAALVLEALRQTGQRGILISGWGGLPSETQVPESVFQAESVPYDWLFPRVALAVHHGGAGTVGLALRHGIPSVVVPFAAEQPFWGRVVARLGVGPEPIPRKHLSAERLAGAIRQALDSRGMAERAAELGAKIAAEDGVGSAAAIIERVGGSQRGRA